MTSPVERMVKVLNDRKLEAGIKEDLVSDHDKPRQESTMRRMAKHISKGESRRCFDSGDESVYL